MHGVALLLAALSLPAPSAGCRWLRWRRAHGDGVANEWHAIHFFFGKRLKHAMIAFTITLVATVLPDLTQAIVIGFGISTLIFVAQMSDLHVARPSTWRI
ncbi:MAG: hypothetical protein R2838_24120 [Caldilineaceae bacterium]